MKERKNKPRPLHVQQILRENRKHQIFPKDDSKPERMMQLALKLKGIKFEKQKLIDNHVDFWHRVDIFIETNICVEVDGDYPHANPEKYRADHIMWKRPKLRLASDIWASDIRITHELTKMGYLVIRIWASDIKKNTQNCAENIIAMIKERQEKTIL